MEEKIKEMFSLPENERMEYFLINICLMLRDDCYLELVDMGFNIVYICSIRYGRFAFRLSDLTLEFADGKMNNAESITKFFVEEIFKYNQKPSLEEEVR